MQALIAHQFKSEISNFHQLIYLPELINNESNLRFALCQHRFHVIIVRNNSVGIKTAELWRSSINYNIQLTIISD